MRHIIWDMGGTLVNTYPEVDRVLCEAAFGDADPEHVRHVTSLTRRSIAHAIATLAVDYLGQPDVQKTIADTLGSDQVIDSDRLTQNLVAGLGADAVSRDGGDGVAGDDQRFDALREEVFNDLRTVGFDGGA